MDRKRKGCAIPGRPSEENHQRALLFKPPPIPMYGRLRDFIDHRGVNCENYITEMSAPRENRLRRSNTDVR